MRKPSEKDRLKSEKSIKLKKYDEKIKIINNSSCTLNPLIEKFINKHIVLPKFYINTEYFSSPKETIIIPKHYITYKESERNKRNESQNIYEPTVYDYHYLENNPELNEKEFIGIVSLLENNIIDPITNLFISREKARNILSTFYLKDQNVIDKIYKVRKCLTLVLDFKTRRIL